MWYVEIFDMRSYLVCPDSTTASLAFVNGSLLIFFFKTVSGPNNLGGEFKEQGQAVALC